MAYTVHNFEQGDVLYAEQLNEMDAQIAANKESIENSVSLNMLAEDWSANKTYSIGDYVIYNNELYTCIYEITAPEGWNSAHWRIYNLGDGISDLNHQISDVEENQIPELKNALDYSDYVITGKSNLKNKTSWINGKYINGSAAIADNSAYQVTSELSVVAGDKYSIVYDLVDGYSRLACFDSNGENGVLLLNDSIAGNDKKYTFEIPSGKTILRFSQAKTSKLFGVIKGDTVDIQKMYEGIFNNIIDLSQAVTGYYIGTDGTIASKVANSGYAYMNPIAISKGSFVSLTAQGNGTSVSMITRYYSDDQLVPLVISIDSTVRTYTYTATEDMYILLCYRIASDHSAYIDYKLDIEKITDITLQTNVEEDNYLYLFHKMGGIGDSLMSGELYYGSGSVRDAYAYSWLSNLSRYADSDCVHYSAGGMTAKDWLDNVGGYKTALENEGVKCNAYFIALGTNDKNQSVYPIGNISDTAGTASFVGYYKQIIELIHSVAPYAFIFCFSMYDNNSISVPYSEIVEDIADLYSYCYFVDFIGNTEHTTKTTGDYAQNSHFTSIGYLYVAKLVKKLINQIVENNKADFKWIGLNE